MDESLKNTYLALRILIVRSMCKNIYATLKERFFIRSLSSYFQQQNRPLQREYDCTSKISLKRYLNNLYFKKFKFLLLVGKKTLFKTSKSVQMAAILNCSMNLITPLDLNRKCRASDPGGL